MRLSKSDRQVDNTRKDLLDTTALEVRQLLNALIGDLYHMADVDVEGQPAAATTRDVAKVYLSHLDSLDCFFGSADELSAPVDSRFEFQMLAHGTEAEGKSRQTKKMWRHKARNPNAKGYTKKQVWVTFQHIRLGRTRKLIRHLQDDARLLRRLASEAHRVAHTIQGVCDLDQYGQQQRHQSAPVCHQHCLPSGWSGYEDYHILASFERDLSAGPGTGRAHWSDSLDELEAAAEKLNGQAASLAAILHNIDSVRRVLRASTKHGEGQYGINALSAPDAPRYRHSVLKAGHHPDFGVIFEMRPDSFCEVISTDIELSSAPICPSPPLASDLDCHRVDDWTDDQIVRDAWGVLIGSGDFSSLIEPQLRHAGFGYDLATWQRFRDFCRRKLDGRCMSKDGLMIGRMWEQFRRAEKQEAKDKTAPWRIGILAWVQGILFMSVYSVPSRNISHITHHRVGNGQTFRS